MEPGGPMRIRKPAIPGVMLAVLISITAILPLPAPAGPWEFHPTVGAGVVYDENVSIAPGESGVEAESDVIASLGLTLPLVRQWHGGSISLTYSPVYEAYRDRSELDHLDHVVALGVERSWSRRSQFDLSHTFMRSERQGRLTMDEVADAVPVVVRRDVITRQTFRASLEAETSRRGSFLLGASWSSVDYDRLDTEATIADSDEYAAWIGYGWIHHPRITSRFLYSFGKVEERLEERDVHTLGYGLEGEIGPRSRLTLTVGGTRAEGDPRVTDSEDESTPTGSLVYSRDWPDETGLSTGYARTVSSSSGLGTAAIAQTVFLGFRKPFGPRWSGSLTANHTRREDVSDSAPGNELGTTMANLSVEYALTKTLGLAAGMSRIRQDLDGSDLDMEFGVYHLELRWHPRGWR